MPWIRFNDAWKSRSFIEIPLIGKDQRKWKCLVWTCALNSAFDLSSSSVGYAEYCLLHNVLSMRLSLQPHMKYPNKNCWVTGLTIIVKFSHCWRWWMIIKMAGLTAQQLPEWFRALSFSGSTGWRVQCGANDLTAHPPCTRNRTLTLPPLPL